MTRQWLARVVLLTALLPLGLLSTRHADARRALQNASCTPSIAAGSGAFGRLVSGSNDFGFRLLRTLLAEKPTGNTFISPASVAFALGMTYDGAHAATADAMAKTLGLTGVPQAEARAQAAALLRRLQSSGDHAGLRVANSLWGHKGARFQPAFLQHAQHDFGATTRTLDFRSADAPAAINRWVSCATGGKIPGIIDRIPEQVVLYLINAVYFHGDWAAPFNPSNTKSHAFTIATGRQVQVPLMSRTGPYPYYKGPNFQAVRLPYVGGRFSMVVALPDNGTSASQLGRQVTAAKWKSWTSKMRQTAGDVSLPRFSFSNTFQLNNPLASMGMRLAFTDNADFTGMCIPNCKISEVRHKTFLAVNEKGTVAAAATSVGMEPTSLPQAQFQMVVDHPFLVTIEDSQTGSILFTGLVANPMG